MIALLIAAFLAWPAPCAADVPCWLRWDAAARTEWYEVWSDDRLCATTTRTVYWPRPGDGCWTEGESRSYVVLACNEAGCGGPSDPVPFGPQDFWCFDSSGRVPCD